MVSAVPVLFSVSVFSVSSVVLDVLLPPSASSVSSSMPPVVGVPVSSGSDTGSGSAPPAKAVVEKAVRHSTAASVTAKVRKNLFFIGVVLLFVLFKIRLRGRGCLQCAAAHKGGKFLRRHVQAPHKLDDLQILLFGLCRFQLP